MQEVDKDGQVFHNVSRIKAQSMTSQVDLVIDIQCELYRLKTKDKFTVALSATLDLSGRPDEKRFNHTGEPSLLDKYDYGMYGRVYKSDQLDNSKVAIYVSHGGLLMKITGDARNLTEVTQSDHVYTLLKRVQG